MKINKKKLLFVCLGNICRSPAAEGVMKSIINANKANANYEVDSAGIGNWHVGQLPDSRMRACGLKRGYVFNSHARQFTKSDFQYFDYIFVMDQENYRQITSLTQKEDERKKVVMLADYITQHANVKIIADPYYGNEKDFNNALDLIEDACQQLFAALETHNKSTNAI